MIRTTLGGRKRRNPRDGKDKFLHDWNHRRGTKSSQAVSDGLADLSSKDGAADLVAFMKGTSDKPPHWPASVPASVEEGDTASETESESDTEEYDATKADNVPVHPLEQIYVESNGGSCQPKYMIMHYYDTPRGVIVKKKTPGTPRGAIVKKKTPGTIVPAGKSRVKKKKIPFVPHLSKYYDKDHLPSKTYIMETQQSPGQVQVYHGKDANEVSRTLFVLLAFVQLECYGYS